MLDNLLYHVYIFIMVLVGIGLHSANVAATPTVKFRWATAKCVQDPQSRPRYNCRKLPKIYNLVWVN